MSDFRNGESMNRSPKTCRKQSSSLRLQPPAAYANIPAVQLRSSTCQNLPFVQPSRVGEIVVRYGSSVFRRVGINRTCASRPLPMGIANAIHVSAREKTEPRRPVMNASLRSAICSLERTRRAHDREELLIPRAAFPRFSGQV